MILLRGGVDTIHLAIKCRLPAELIADFGKAKILAAEQRAPAPLGEVHFGVPLSVRDHGARGGFAYVGDTGPIGEVWSLRDCSDRSDWNVLARPSAIGLLAHGYHGSMRNIFDRLRHTKSVIEDHSVSRIDYAIDILANDFVLDPELFVTHARAKKRPHWTGDASQDANCDAQAVLQGQTYQSFTIGTMPGRQIIVYEKTAEIRAAKKDIWFDVWKVPPGSRVWRVEIRAGKGELRGKCNVRNLTDLESSLRKILTAITTSIRYLDVGQTDRNVSRRRLHPLWGIVVSHLQEAELIQTVSAIAPARALQIDCEHAIAQHESMILGNAAGIAARLGMTDEMARQRLPSLVGRIIHRDAARHDGALAKSLRRARQKHRTFECEPDQPKAGTP